MSVFATRLKDLIIKKGLMQIEIAEDLNFTRTQINNWCVDRAKPKYEELLQLVQYFNVTTDYLLGNSAEMRSEEHIATKLPQDERYILDLYEQMDEEHRENITATMELFVRNSKKQGRKFNA